MSLSDGKSNYFGNTEKESLETIFNKASIHSRVQLKVIRIRCKGFEIWCMEVRTASLNEIHFPL